MEKYSLRSISETVSRIFASNSGNVFLKSSTEAAQSNVWETLSAKFFLSWSHCIGSEFSEHELDKLIDYEHEAVNIINNISAERNSEFFEDEVDKLDKCAT